MNNNYFKIAILIALLIPISSFAAHYAGARSGYILLQVEKNGEAWYVFPTDGNRYYLGRPADAFAIMKKLALGAKHDFIANTTIFPDKLSGLILLDVERNGEAYYIYPKDKKKYYLGRPADAFRIMGSLGQGISNAGLINLPVGEISNAPAPTPTVTKALLDVPFTSQAPFGGWNDQRQEDGCEEASVLMAVKWARNESLTSDEALKQILGASDYTLQKYHEYRDISPTDTLNWLIKDYFKYPNAVVKNNISLSEIIAEINKGNLIIAPMNGQILHNPYYVPPGPPNHMLVIRGYDPSRNIFITNDPGTRRGELYEYDAKILYEAIRAYPTGYHELIEKIQKNVIVVWK